MGLSDVAYQFASDPDDGYRNLLRFIHFVGLALGLGGATLLDLMMLRFFIRGRIISETFSIFEFAAKVVEVGLYLLWFTGLGFLVLYALTDPELLTNPKVHAKLCIVMILTANGYFIHKIILPSVKRQIGKTLFEGMGDTRRSVFILSGAISAVSWYVPVALGVFPQFNFQVPMEVILGGYLVLIVTLAAAMHVLMYAMHKYVPEFDAGSDYDMAALSK